MATHAPLHGQFMPSQSAKIESVRVWDPLVRTFHWGLVSCMVLSWLSAARFDRLHQYVGYIIAVLILTRSVWGVFGSHYARFSQFVRSPGHVLLYLRDVLVACEARYVGHNPAGGTMVVALMLVIAATAATGWWQTTDAGWGVEWVQDLHHRLADLIGVMVALHLGGVLLASFRHRENLVRAMITGHKSAPALEDWS